MTSHFYLYEQAKAVRQQDLQREIEQQRLLKSLPQQHPDKVRLAAGRLGTLLVVLGTRLQGVEQQQCEPAMP